MTVDAFYSYLPNVDFAAVAATARVNLGAATTKASNAFSYVQGTAQGYYDQIPSEVCYTPLEIAQGVAMIAVVAFLAGKLLGESVEPIVQREYVPFPIFIEAEQLAPQQPTIEAAAN